jgi:dienelactone hydrolase
MMLAGLAARGDVVKLKDGRELRGIVDRDGTLMQVFDFEGLRRVVLRDSKVASTTSEPAPKAERFRLEQPLEVHAGEMPPNAVQIEATPWNELGRRRFSFVTGSRGKRIVMSQAINELGPYAVRYRGIDGFWQGSLDISRVPKPVVLGLLARFDPTKFDPANPLTPEQVRDERLRVGRFLIQAGWYPEALAELDALDRDYPELKETVAQVRPLVLEEQARAQWAEIRRRQAARQPREAERRLRAFDATGASPEVATDVRNALRVIDARNIEDRELARAIRDAADGLEPESRRIAEPLLLELLAALAEAPDAVRDALARFVESRALPPDQRLALALSGWLTGADFAEPDLAAVGRLAAARTALRGYLRATDPEARLRLLSDLESLAHAGVPGEAVPAPPPPRPSGTALPEAKEGAWLDLPRLTALARRMAPPLHDATVAQPGEVRLLRVHDDPYPDQPSEYAAWLPPEYHPLRRYPAVVVLHGPETPAETLTDWTEQAARRGLILIAPEWRTGTTPGYRYTTDESAVVQIVLRDALKRFAIDANRVYLAGTLEGGNMAWDLGLAHPDLFAATAVLSGLPGKYVWANRGNQELMPLYITIGELAPAEDPVAFEQWTKPLISRNTDLTYVKYYRRGLEPLPEEIPAILDWFVGRVREPAPKRFMITAAREGDDRFYGVVIRGFEERRAVRPEAADPLGKNLKPAELEVRANAVLNKLTVTTKGTTGVDVWLGPAQVDWSKRVEVLVNERPVYRGTPPMTRFADYLEDLRIRGDREQTYWLKLSGDPKPARRR